MEKIHNFRSIDKAKEFRVVSYSQKGFIMPSNIVQINENEKMTWIVPDSKMEELIKKLDECGDKEDAISSDVSPLPYSQSES